MGTLFQPCGRQLLRKTNRTHTVIYLKDRPIHSTQLGALDLRVLGLRKGNEGKIGDVLELERVWSHWGSGVGV